MLQFLFKYLHMAPTCFGPFRPSSGSIYWNLTKVTVSLKYQLKHIVKIIVVIVIVVIVITIILTMCFN
jgi:hypothetical protein